ncbi:MAG: penicillin-binding protein 1C [Endomicrobia bacterium]|nr:penicillin-binding protein 1C [Endomicrobiia bacterium]
MFKPSGKKYLRLAAILLAVCLIFVAVRIWPRESLLHKYSFSRSFFSSSGELLRFNVSHDDKYRTFIALKEIPRNFQEAVLLYEDRYFYYHPGVNPVSLIKGFNETFIKKSRRQGASTITMQTARIIYNLNTKTLTGKLKQIFLSLWLEMRYSKKDILEAYLNLAPYGYNIEGAPAAALTYFKKRIADINLIQSLTLAVIPQNPNQRRPDTQDGYENMKGPRDALYKEWIKKHPEDKDKEHFITMPLEVYGPGHRPFYAPHLVNYLDFRSNTSEVFSSIDLPLQKLYEEKITKYLNHNASKGINNASVVLLDTRTMQARVLVGSADFNNDAISGQINGVTSKRMAGSVLKSFIYAIALDKGIIHPMTLMKDTPQYFGIFAPENSDRQFAGPVFAKDALINSRNIPAMELALKIGIDEFLEFLRRGGVSQLKTADYYGISAAVGSLDITPLECARLYAAVANYGTLREISFTREPSASSGIQILTPEASFILFDMLSSNPPPKPSLKIYDSYKTLVEVAWKTGTSYSFKDAWAAGIFGDYVLVVWVGNFSGQGNPHFWGRTAAGELFFELAALTVRNKPEEIFLQMLPEGLNVKKVEVCATSGDLPGRFSPKTVKDFFIPGVSPIKTSDVYRQVIIDKKTGLRTSRYKEGETYYKVYEFWPKEILLLFEQAGIKKQSIPRYMPGCDIEETSLSGFAPEIVLPVKDVIYYVDAANPSRKIALKASADADARSLYWFIDGIFVGSSKNGESLFVQMQQGTHKIQVSDDLGRHSYSYITVTLEN